ncbi:MAG: maleylacetoacetate isomerase [Pseudomonadota bacterium]|jgi:maleylpyruvate isomerase|uniref:maleylacetoacetate isomerase n=1 Tax=Burkholderiaceae TaxID=119060 RepID=UPI0010F9BB7C|nr:maleylacetoacetate isomerase [Burkholderia sp. 4M9327F10]
MVTLHDFHRSSASFRVRIALNLKRLRYDQVVHDLDTGAHRASAYLAVNPQGLLPALVTGTQVLTQSLAILEFLETAYPDPPLLPATPLEQARVRALFQVVAADTHPLTTMRAGHYLKAMLGADDAAVKRWKQHWMIDGLAALETLLAADPATGRYCHGTHVSFADIALVPQVVSAQKLGIVIEEFPAIARIVEHCMQLQAFQDAHPDACSPQPTLIKE